MIKETYKNHEVVLDENEEVWKCGDLAIANSSLKARKRQIDAASKQRRRVAMPCLYLEDAHYIDVPRIHRATIVLLREGDRKADIKIDGEKKNFSQQVDISDLYPLSEQKKLVAYKAARIKERKAAADAEAANEALVALTAKAIREEVARTADANPPPTVRRKTRSKTAAG